MPRLIDAWRKRSRRSDGTRRRTGPAHRWTALVVVAAVVAAGACTRRPPIGGAGLAALTRFDSCASAERYLQDAALERVGPYGLGGSYGYFRGGIGVSPPMAMPGGARDSAGAEGGGGGSAPVPAHSGTNTQEVGVDEPDVVKNDGRRLLSVLHNRLDIIDLTAATPRVAGSLALANQSGNHQLLLQGDRVLVISSEWDYGIYPPGGPIIDDGPMVAPGRPAGGVGAGMMYRPSVPRTRLTMVSIAEIAKPAVLHSVLVDGSYVDARFVGGRARVVTNAGMRPLPWVMPTDGTEPALRAAQRANEGVIRRTTAADWLPQVHPADKPEEGDPLVACDDLSRPPEFSGFNTVSVMTIDLGGNQINLGDTVAVAANAQTVYSSTKNLYVATQATTDVTYAGRLPEPTRPGAPVTVPPVKEEPDYSTKTELHAFDVSGSGAAAYRASGSVDGALLNQWSLSEHKDHLRVVTTTGNFGCGGCVGDQSQMNVLRFQGRDLVVVGKAGGMGKGEAVKGVRFLGDRAYVVTFRQIDPFYVVDLADPAKPAVVGELKMPGYSAYLHPVGGNQVLGVGRDATAEGRVTGIKVSLYDVADAAKPAEVRSITMPDSYTSVEQTAKAFLWWEPEKLAMVPVVSYGNAIDRDGVYKPTGFTGAIGINVGAGALAERGRVSNEGGPYGPSEIVRSAVVGDKVLTVSYSGVRVSDLGSLAARAWVAFPEG